MEQSEDKKLVAEMNDFLADKTKRNGSGNSIAEESLPFESIDSYSTDPVGFSEMSLRMLGKVEFIFDLAAKENRFSSKYLKRCAQLEKGIKYLGTLSITKFALQMKGHPFPELGQLSTEKLFGMASHHYRKLDQAVTEYMFEHQDIHDKLFDMEMRYFNLLERLRSTEAKIRKFHMQHIFGPEDESPIVHGLAFTEKSWTKEIHKKFDEAPAFRHAPAFSPAIEINDRKPKTDREQASLPQVNAAADAAPAQPSCAREALPPSGEEAAGSFEEIPQKQEILPVGDQAKTENEETAPLRREQLSRTGSRRKVSEMMPAPERSKEALVSETGQEPQNTGRDPEAPAPVDPAKLPLFAVILQRVFEERRNNGGDLIFTEDEIRFLAADPLFARCEPKMAADIRRAAAEIDSG